MRTLKTTIIALAFLALPVWADQAPRAARSVHLWYKAPEAEIFYNEVTPLISAPGTYFCVCGFRHGYFGIQQLSTPGRKIVIFSVWDPGKQNIPDQVPPDKRVKVLHQGQNVRVSRFGYEGTGAKSIFPFQWQIGRAYRCLVTATTHADKTTYAAYFYIDDTKGWKHLATFQTITGGDHLKGYYSFIEDFLRNGTSATQRRKALFGNGWVRTLSGHWVALTHATFTADNTPSDNIDAGISNDAFYLATGGETRNTHSLGSVLKRLPKGLSLPRQLQLQR